MLVAAVAVLSCSPARDEDELFAPGGAGIPVVDAMLVVGQRFPDVYVTRTLAPNRPFSLQAAGITGASVVIRSGTERIRFGEVLSSPGHYSPIDSGIVRSGATYHLRVDLLDGRTVRATTTTPSPLRVRDWVLLDAQGRNVVRTLTAFSAATGDPDSIYYLPENQLAYTEGLLEVRLENDPAVGYLVGLQSLDLASPLLIEGDFLDDEDLESFTRVTSSPPFEARENFLRIPWFAIYFQGRYKMRVFTMDRNWYDLARTDPVLGAGGFGFGGEAGDNIVSPIFHVEGGVGLFGSMSSDSVGFFVNPR